MAFSELGFRIKKQGFSTYLFSHFSTLKKPYFCYRIQNPTFFNESRQQKSTFFYHIRNSATPWFFLKMTRISFDFHQTILEIQFKIMINFVQFFADEILIFIISEFRKIQKNTQKNAKESLTKKVTFFPKN